MKTMKLIMLFVIASMCVSSMYGQEAKTEKLKTKMESFVSKTGAMMKFVDTKLPILSTTYTKCETRIRKIVSNQESEYFYQIEKSGKYGDKVASVAYEDLLELIKATEKLQTEVDADIALNPDYLENKFITDDGLQIGYYVSNGKATWYIKLKKYESKCTLFLNDVSKILAAFVGAKDKIEAMK